MNRVQSKKTGPQKALLKRLIWNAQNALCLPTSEVHSVFNDSCYTLYKRTVALSTSRIYTRKPDYDSHPCTQTGHNTLSPRFKNTTTNPETPFYRNPLSKAKAYSAGAKGNRRQGFQKGLVISRSNPGLFTHHFNTGKKPPKASLEKEQPEYGSLQLTPLQQKQRQTGLAPHSQEKHALLIQLRCLPTKKATKMENRGTSYKILHDGDKQARIKWSL